MPARPITLDGLPALARSLANRRRRSTDSNGAPYPITLALPKGQSITGVPLFVGNTFTLHDANTHAVIYSRLIWPGRRA